MVQKTNMRNFIGIVKDRLSLSKHMLLSKPNTSYLHVAVLHTTTHTPSTPPKDHHLATLLSVGDSSRATASVIIYSLTNRLNHTSNSYVALKCLLTIHHIIKRGPFILKDQLSVLLSTGSGGRNNLKLSGFHDGASATTWVLSGWVRWYARYIETIIFTSKITAFVVTTPKTKAEREKQQGSILSFVSSDLTRDFGSLVGVIEEICKVPDNLPRDRLVRCVMELLANDYLSTVSEILLLLSEFKERVNLLSYNDSAELASGLERLSSCKEKLFELFTMKKTSVETLWEMVAELNNKIGTVEFQKTGTIVRVSQLCWVAELRNEARTIQ
ncbi:hypothetical protein R6Q59_007920 [Mikania micrantha]